MTAHATATPPARPSLSRATAALACVLLLGGCGLRFETPAPTEPTPGADEVMRETAVLDAIAVGDVVTDATPAISDDGVLEILGQAGDFAAAHVDALGGVYDSGLPDGTESPGDPAASPEPSTTPEPATTDDVVTALVAASQRTRASADATTDAELARLLASVATSEHVSARRLAAATKSHAADDLDVTPPTIEDAPKGVSASDLATVVASEDSAGYAYEVRAAQTDGDPRTAAVARATVHRSRAESWAIAAGTQESDQDPRRVAYTMPDDELAPLAQQLETDLASSYASLVGSAPPQSRTVATGLLIDSWSAAVTWGATPVAFPGLPEQTGEPADG